jgi:hypothetical protein
MAFVATWLRLSSNKQLTWYRKSARQGKDIAHSQKVLAQRMADKVGAPAARMQQDRLRSSHTFHQRRVSCICMHGQTGEQQSHACGASSGCRTTGRKAQQGPAARGVLQGPPPRMQERDLSLASAAGALRQGPDVPATGAAGADGG